MHRSCQGGHDEEPGVRNQGPGGGRARRGRIDVSDVSRCRLLLPPDSRLPAPRGGPMPEHGYPRFPTIHHETIVFASEDDLWITCSRGGQAIRLTAGVGEASYPRLSPDGGEVAFVGREEGPAEVYVVPVAGGTARRLTFQAAQRVSVVGWSADGRSVLYAS